MYIVVLDRPFYPEAHESSTMEEAEKIYADLKSNNDVKKDENYVQHNSKLYIAQILKTEKIITDY